MISYHTSVNIRTKGIYKLLAAYKNWVKAIKI